MATSANDKAYLKHTMVLTASELAIPDIKTKAKMPTRDNVLAVARTRTPQVIKGYRIPNYMRAEACRLLQSDTGNSALEKVINASSLSLPHNEHLGAYLKLIEYPFFFWVPSELKGIAEGAPDFTIPEFIVWALQHDAPEDSLNRTKASAKGVEAWQRAVGSLNSMVPYLDAMGNTLRDPRAIAAVAIVMFSMFPPFKLHNLNISAGCFLANVVLLAEDYPPVPGDLIESAGLFHAVSADVAKWRLRESKDACVDNTLAFLKVLQRRCFICSKENPSVCRKCGYTWYCGDDCAQLAESLHGPTCQANVRQAEEFPQLVKVTKNGG